MIFSKINTLPIFFLLLLLSEAVLAFKSSFCMNFCRVAVDCSRDWFGFLRIFCELRCIAVILAFVVLGRLVTWVKSVWVILNTISMIVHSFVLVTLILCYFPIAIFCRLCVDFASCTFRLPALRISVTFWTKLVQIKDQTLICKSSSSKEKRSRTASNKKSKDWILKSINSSRIPFSFSSLYWLAHTFMSLVMLWVEPEGER